MVQQEPLASRLPYHAGPGNHEDYDDFVHYRFDLVGWWCCC